MNIWKKLQLLIETFALTNLFSTFDGDESKIISKEGLELTRQSHLIFLNLNEHREKNTDGSYKRVFTSREHGKQIRDLYGLTQLDSNNYKIFIIVPYEVYSVTPSFFEGLIGDIASNLGRDEFSEKVSLITPNVNIERSFTECISRVNLLRKF